MKLAILVLFGTIAVIVFFSLIGAAVAFEVVKDDMEDIYGK